MYVDTQPGTVSYTCSSHISFDFLNKQCTYPIQLFCMHSARDLNSQPASHRYHTRKWSGPSLPTTIPDCKEEYNGTNLSPTLPNCTRENNWTDLSPTFFDCIRE